MIADGPASLATVLDDPGCDAMPRLLSSSRERGVRVAAESLDRRPAAKARFDGPMERLSLTVVAAGAAMAWEVRQGNLRHGRDCRPAGPDVTGRASRTLEHAWMERLRAVRTDAREDGSWSVPVADESPERASAKPGSTPLLSKGADPSQAGIVPALA